MTIPQGGVVPHINPELLKKRKGGKLIPPPEPKPKNMKGGKKALKSTPVKAAKEPKVPKVSQTTHFLIDEII